MFCCMTNNESSFPDIFGTSQPIIDGTERFIEADEYFPYEVERGTYDNASPETIFADIEPQLNCLQMSSRSISNEEAPTMPNLGYGNVLNIHSEVAQKPPPSYENVVFPNEGSPMSDDSHRSTEISRIPKSTTTANSNTQMGRRGRFGPYEKYKDQSGKIKVEEIDDPAERERVLEKRVKNRIAATKARHKRRDRIGELENEKSRTERLIFKEDSEIQNLNRKLDYLRVSFEEHQRVCYSLIKA